MADSNDFGFKLIHISYAGPDILIIDRHGKKWKFEDHHYCGPSALGRDGNPLANQPPESSPFGRLLIAGISRGKSPK